MKKSFLLILFCIVTAAVDAQTTAQQTQLQKAIKTTWLNTDTINNGSQATALYYTISGKQLIVHDVYYERKNDSMQLDFLVEKTIPLTAITGVKLKDVTNPADESYSIFECRIRLKPGTIFTESYFTKSGLLKYKRKELLLYFSRVKSRAEAFITHLKKQTGIQ